jgi:hypothetical protein
MTREIEHAIQKVGNTIYELLEVEQPAVVAEKQNQ